MMVSCPASPLWPGRKLPSQRLFLHFLAKRGGHPNPVDRGSDEKDKMLPPKAPIKPEKQSETSRSFPSLNVKRNKNLKI